MMSTRGSSVLKSVPVVSRSLRSFASQDSIPPSEPVQREVKEVRIPVPWGHIAGKWWSPHDVKPVIALHGWQDNANTWDTLAPLISPDIGLLCIDFVGHGLSSHYPPGVIYHHLEYVGMLRRVIKHYGWTDITLLGHSMGSGISFLYATMYPDEVSNYIAIDLFHPISSTPEVTLFTWNSVVEKLVDSFSWDQKNAPTYTYKNALDHFYQGYKNSLTRESAEILLQRAVVKQTDGKYRFTKDPLVKYISLSSLDEESYLRLSSKVRCNVLHILATSSVRQIDPQDYRHCLLTACQSAKKFKHYEVEGTHHVHLNNPERIAPLINEFLSGVGL